ncbi:MAG: hypothetical protein V7L01_25055 [Nostoc sp.]
MLSFIAGVIAAGIFGAIYTLTGGGSREFQAIQKAKIRYFLLRVRSLKP